jgi:hypothetical protein
VLRALGREEWLGTLAPQVSISPRQVLKNQEAFAATSLRSKGRDGRSLRRMT